MNVNPAAVATNTNHHQPLMTGAAHHYHPGTTPHNHQKIPTFAQTVFAPERAKFRR